MAAKTRSVRSAAAKKAIKKRRQRAAGKNAAKTRSARPAGRKAAGTRKRSAVARKAAATLHAKPKTQAADTTTAPVLNANPNAEPSSGT